MSLQDTDAVFQATRWPLVAALHGDDVAKRNVALQSLVAQYWPPIYAYIRCHRGSREEAVELTQAFFTDVVLERKLFERADQSRGRLRSLLIAGLKRFLTDDHRHRAARATIQAVPQDELVDEKESLIDASADPAETFDRRWAVIKLEQALQEAQRQLIQSGRGAFWIAFERRVLRPSTSSAGADALSEVAIECGFDSPGHAAAAVQAVKKRVTALLRETVAATLASPADQEDEFLYLVKMLGSGSMARERTD